MNLLLLALPIAISNQPLKPISLFDGNSLAGWHADIPDRDSKPELPVPFLVRNHRLVSLGTPMGHLITDKSFDNYELLVEYRWPKEPGNSGIIVHASKPRLLNNFLPQGIEAQLKFGNAGDFHLFGETLFSASDPKVRAGSRYSDAFETPKGEWNTMKVACEDDTILVTLNGNVVNFGKGCSATKGQIAIQSEGAEIEFRKVELTKLK